MKTWYRNGLLLTAALAGLGASAPGSSRHLRLVSAEPALDTTVFVAPSVIRLHWSQEPQLKGTSIHLLNAAKKDVVLGEPKAEGEKATTTLAVVKGALPHGAYKVVWRTMAQDGHVIKGEFGFTYKAQTEKQP